VYPRVLANIEGMQMEPKGAHLKDERVNKGARDAQPSMGSQRGP